MIELSKEEYPYVLPLLINIASLLVAKGLKFVTRGVFGDGNDKNYSNPSCH
jgi:hypothetical protein